MRMCETQLYEGTVTTCPMCLKGFSGEELKDPDRTYFEVTSWVTGPKKQSPVMRQASGRVAHRSCIEKILDNVAPDQEPIPGIEV